MREDYTNPGYCGITAARVLLGQEAVDLIERVAEAIERAYRKGNHNGYAEGYEDGKAPVSTV